MRKLEIDYDFIDKIYESEGKYKLKRYIKDNPFNTAIVSGFVAKDLFLGFTGAYTPEETAVTIASYIGTMSVILFLLENLRLRLRERTTGKTREENAEDELRELAVQLNNLGIEINLDDLYLSL